MGDGGQKALRQVFHEVVGLNEINVQREITGAETCYDV